MAPGLLHTPPTDRFPSALNAQIGSGVAIAEVLAIGERLPAAHHAQVHVLPTAADLRHSAAVAVDVDHPQTDFRTHRSKAGEQAAGLGPEWVLRNFRSVNAGQADRQLLAAVVHPQGVAITDGEQSGRLGEEGTKSE